MSSLGVALVTLSPDGSRLVERHGQRVMLLFSLTFMAAGMIMLTLLPVWGGIANVVAGICIFGVGFGLIRCAGDIGSHGCDSKGESRRWLGRKHAFTSDRWRRGCGDYRLAGVRDLPPWVNIVRVPTDRATAERGRAVAQRRHRAEQPTRGRDDGAARHDGGCRDGQRCWGSDGDLRDRGCIGCWSHVLCFA